MPELPEVETVRQGLAGWVVGRSISAVEVLHPRAVRRHPAGAADFAGVLAGRTILAANRRGKYLWLPLDSGDAVVGHLGMSGQLLIQPATAPDGPHLRVRFDFADGGPQLRFVDQRTFGGLAVSPGGAELPGEIAHIARDPMDPLFDDEAFVARLRSRHTEVKRALLDQTLISGVGNIYADEALWRAAAARPAGHRRAHPPRRAPAARPRPGRPRRSPQTRGYELRRALRQRQRRERLLRPLAERLRARGLPCRRCGAPIRREAFMNRSSFFCPRCQPPPRRPAPPR